MSRLDWTLWNMDGARMVQMTEADFSDRLPSKHGENLYAQFDIWRTNYNYEGAQAQYAPPPPYPDTSYWPAPGNTENTENTDTFGDIAYMLQVDNLGIQCMPCTQASKPKCNLRHYSENNCKWFKGIERD